MGINYDYYRIFYHVAKYRSFTQAANALMNSQPNITRAIKNLEQELGCTLFIRTNRLVKLTPEGEALFRHVSVAFDQLQAGEEEITRGKGLDGGVLRIAATEVALRAFLLPVLAQFRTRHPGVRIKLFNGSAPTKASLRNMVYPKPASPSGVENSAKNARRKPSQIQILQTKWSL